MTQAGRVRPFALAIIRRGDAILVGESRDSVKDETFYGPVGGEIDFGERAAEAVARELREEPGVMLERAELRGVLENLFTFEATPGHEIIFVYDVETAEALPEGRIPIADEVAVWMPLDTCRHGGPPRYPDGLYELLTE